MVYQGQKDRAAGPFLTVLWENLTDPILTGREQLGFSKIYCELPEPVVYNGETHCTASWMGFRFLDIKLTHMKEVAPEDYPTSPFLPADGTLSGTIHYKYMPRTGEWGQEDAAYAVLSPASEKPEPPQSLMQGEGTIEFHRARWEDLPTQYMVVNAFSDLEIKEYRRRQHRSQCRGREFLESTDSSLVSCKYVNLKKVAYENLQLSSY